MEIISRENAIKINQKWYFTGIECRNGHIDKRYVNTGICYQCKRDLNKTDYKNHRERIKEGYKRCGQKPEIKEKRKLSAYKWAAANVQKVKEIKRRNKEKHRTKYNELEKIRYREKRKTDPYFRLSRNLSKEIWMMLKELNNNKNGKSWLSFIKYSREDLIKHIESQFSIDMNWDNYGTYWELDHIKPLSWFKDLTPEEAVRQAWDLNNLQPLEIYLNRSKQNYNNLNREKLMDNYIAKTLRTENKDISGIKDRLQDEHTMKLLHGVMGLSTEAGELLDILKKHIFYGKPIDEVHIIEEMGDIFYYLAVIANELDIDFEEIMKKNIEKLEARYPNGFSKHDALNRNLDVERQILEK